MDTVADWGAWSKEAVVLMTARTRELLARHAILEGSAYHWDLATGLIVIGGVTFRLVTVGTTVAEAFLWSWANEGIPPSAKADIARVRQFGVDNDLSLLVEPSLSGGLAQAKECLALAARVLDAQGIWIDQTSAGHIFFALHERTDWGD